MSDKKLKPCPFCGSVPTGEDHGDLAVVNCQNTACVVQPYAALRTLSESAEAWNTRAALSPAPLSEADIQAVYDAASGHKHDSIVDALAEHGLAIVRVRP